jgi:2'-5' RNA ligase
MRCFIAIDLPVEVREVLARVMRKIVQKRLIDAKFVEIDNLHLTMKFLGEIDVLILEKIQENLKNIKQACFSVTLDGLGVFTPEFPRVLWAALDGPAIFVLAEKIEQATEKLVPREQRSFAAHVTLARIKRVLSDEFYEFIEIGDTKKLTFTVDQFVLKKSELTRDGPIYTDIACYQLKDSGH